MQDSMQLRLWIFGFQISQAIHVSARLGLADMIEEQALATETLADRAGCNRDALQRLLRALASIGLFTETPEGFAHTKLSRLLRRDHPHSQFLAAAVYGAEHYGAWGDLLQAVRSGEPVFQQRYGFDYYTYLERHAKVSGVYRDYLAHDEAQRNNAVHSAYDGYLRDQWVEVTDHDGEFAANADVYVVSHRLHRLDDAPAIALLNCCRRAMHADSRLLVVELMLHDQPDFDPGRWMDLNSLLLCGGRERSQVGYVELAAQAGLSLVSARSLNTGMTLLAFRPA